MPLHDRTTATTTTKAVIKSKFVDANLENGAVAFTTLENIILVQNLISITAIVCPSQNGFSYFCSIYYVIIVFAVLYVLLCELMVLT